MTRTKAILAATAASIITAITPALSSPSSTPATRAANDQAIPLPCEPAPDRIRCADFARLVPGESVYFIAETGATPDLIEVAETRRRVLTFPCQDPAIPAIQRGRGRLDITTQVQCEEGRVGVAVSNPRDRSIVVGVEVTAR